MSKPVLHKQLYRPGAFGGTVNTTRWGRLHAGQEMNVADADTEVTWKFYLQPPSLLAAIALAVLCFATGASAAGRLPPNTDQDFADIIKQHRPGFTACDASPAFLRQLKLPMARADLERILGAPGVISNIGELPKTSLQNYKLHWDGPHSFWNAEISHDPWVWRLVVLTPDNRTYMADRIDGVREF